MSQFLLLLIAFIPLCNCLVFSLAGERFINISSKFFPILFLAILLGSYSKMQQAVEITLINATNISFGLEISNKSFLQLFLFSFLWLVFAFYSHRLLRLFKAKFISEFKLFFACFIAAINLIFLAKNLLSLFFFYSCLIFLCHFFALKFVCINDKKFSKVFSLLFFAQILLFAAAIFLTYHLTSSINFADGGIFLQEFQLSEALPILILYAFALFFIILLPLYFLCHDLKIDMLFIYVLFFLSYGFVGLALFIKLLSNIFGTEVFALLIQQISVKFVEWFFLIAISIATFMLVLSNTIKISFFYLFFQQLIFAIFSVILLAMFAPNKMYFPLISFSLNLTLIFIVMSNLLLYLNKAGNKSLEGLFWNLRVTSILLIFVLLSFFGISPSVALIEKITLLKIIVKQDLLLSRLIIIVNFFGLIVVAKKLLYPLLAKTEEKKIDDDVALAQKLDNDSALVLTGFAVAVVLVLSLFPIFP